jgi:hypothetical protein
LHQDELEAVQQRPYDFILGSVHDWGQPYHGMYQGKPVSGSECYAVYWDYVRDMAACGGFDAIAMTGGRAEKRLELGSFWTFLNRVLLRELAHCLLHCSGFGVPAGGASPNTFPGMKIKDKHSEGGQHFDWMFFGHEPQEVMVYGLFMLDVIYRL